MSSAKGQFKWLVKHFAGFVLLLLIVAAGLAYFTSLLSVANFSTMVFAVVVTVLVLAYYGLMNVRAVLIYAVIAAVLLVGVTLSHRPVVKSNQFQAVFLTGGAVYFGHLKNADSANPTLTDVYFLHTQASGQATDTTKQTQTPVLSRLSSEAHSPENEMTIKGDQILFWENLQDSSKVSQAIKKDLQK